jgi:hypothetical protein
VSCPVGGNGLRLAEPVVTGLSKEQLIQLACTLARVGAALCEVLEPRERIRYGIVDEDPYIWDIKED